MEYAVLAFYDLVSVEMPVKEAENHKKFLQTLDSRGRIYISEQGINAQLSLHKDDIDAYIEYIQKKTPFSSGNIKVDPHPEHAFEKLSVRYRKQLVAIDQEVDLQNRGESVPPEEWKALFEDSSKKTIVIDVRNDYESKVGHFEGAICPQLRCFRDFPEFAKSIRKEHDPQTTRVLMYCTGGIRCEYFSPLLKQEGFEEVYQLDGGIIKYLQQDKTHWKGRLFVFDDRVVVHEDQDQTIPITTCSFCKELSDVYYNCANMECNALFLACPDCYQSHRGCCSGACTEASRVRPPVDGKYPKPFRRFQAEA